MMKRPSAAPTARPPRKMMRVRRKGALASLRSRTYCCSLMPPAGAASEDGRGGDSLA
jgi:hypothetical protein